MDSIEEVGEEIEYGGKENMWKYLAALLVVLLSMGGIVAAQTPCVDCYANVITQIDTQRINDVRIGLGDPADPVTTVAIGNEGLSAAIIVAKPPVQPVDGATFIAAPFARIDQRMDQTISNLGNRDPFLGEGAKGITWNKAIQAAWIANQGVKELEVDEEGNEFYAKEGAYISQSTTQLTNDVYDYAGREGAKVLNVDNKLAMIVDSMEAVIDLTANADSSTTDSQTSEGTIINNVNVTIAGKDP
jgi:hypothetical protein